MKKIQAFFSILLFVFFVAGVADARLYKWVDDNGVAHFSDSPPTRANTSGKVEAVSGKNKAGAPSVTYSDIADQSGRGPSTAAVGNGSQPTNHNVQTTVGNGQPKKQSPPRVASKRKSKKRDVPEVELYTTSWCPYCTKAKRFFRSRGILFKEYDITKDKAAARRKKKLDRKGGGVPFVVIKGKGIHGYSERAYELALR